MKKMNSASGLAKLKLNKETLVVLTSDMLRTVAGGQKMEPMPTMTEGGGCQTRGYCADAI
jgi:hypothetical protein